VTLRRRVQAVPSNNNGARPFLRVEPQQEIGEAKYRASCIAIAAANGFRQRVVRSMGEGVAVDDQQRAARGIMLARANGWVWRLSGTPVPRADFLAFDEALVGVVASRLRQRSQKWAGWAHREAPPIRACGRWRPRVLVCDDRCRRFADAPSKRNSAECDRDADRHRAPNGSACSPKTCTSVPWDGVANGVGPALREKALIRSAALRLQQGVAIPGLRRIDVEVCRHKVVVSREHDGRSSRVESAAWAFRCDP
jgi:hypothetical protein